MISLLLFDIDGTLVQGASTAHAQALRSACERVHGVALSGSRMSVGSVPRIEIAGRTDGEIARLLLLDAGVSAAVIDERADAVREECGRLYAELCPPDLSGAVVRGIPAVLERLAARDDARLSLLTGNFEAVARLKLRRADLGRWFEPGQGGFGSDSEDRTMLPAIARRRAGADGVSWPRSATIVIGDTPRDIACARADQVRCVAVTSGPYDADALSAADAVAAGPEQLGELIASML